MDEKKKKHKTTAVFRMVLTPSGALSRFAEAASSETSRKTKKTKPQKFLTLGSLS
jgi:hypothetical protein